MMKAAAAGVAGAGMPMPAFAAVLMLGAAKDFAQRHAGYPLAYGEIVAAARNDLEIHRKVAVDQICIGLVPARAMRS